MAKLLKLRRGTTTQHASFTGAEGEVTIDITKDTAVVHDGSQAGGRPLAREDMANVSSASIAGQLGTDSIATSKIAAGALPTDVTITNANIVANASIAGTKLENSGVSAGQYGSSSAIPIVTVDAQGLVTAASTTAVDSTKIQNGTTEVATANAGDITMKRSGTTRLKVDGAGVEVTGTLDVSGQTNINGGVLRLGQADTASGHLNSYEVMTFNIDSDNDDTNRAFKWYKDGSSGSGTQLLALDEAGTLTLGGQATLQGGVAVTGNISVSGTVDGVDVANLKTAKDSLSTSNGVIKTGVELASGVIASTQAQSDNSTKVATTGYVRTAITEAKPFPTGTAMLFAQSSAPTGWTKSTTHNNKALRVVSGSASSGGSNAFTTAFGSARGISANAANTTAAGNVSSSAGNTTATGNVSVSVANSTQGGNVSIGDTTAGGNVSISSVSTSGSVSSHTLSTNEMPSHSHTVLTAASRNQWRNSGQGFQTSWLNFYNTGRSQGSGNTESQGGNGGHSHGFSGSSHNHNGSLSGTAHNHNASFSGSAHNHNATGSFTGTAHNHNVSSSFSGTAHNHSISVGNLDMAVQYVDVIIATKD